MLFSRGVAELEFASDLVMRVTRLFVLVNARGQALKPARPVPSLDITAVDTDLFLTVLVQCLFVCVSSCSNFKL